METALAVALFVVSMLHHFMNFDYCQNKLTQFLTKFNQIHDPVIKHNQDLQVFYDHDSQNLFKYLHTQQQPFLCSGQSGYFNEQVDQKGLSDGLKISAEDIADAKFIAECFGKHFDVADNNLSIMYTAMLGETPLFYANQSFPANILEDVFQFSESFPIPLVVGEAEPDYFLRAFMREIKRHHTHFPKEKTGIVIEKAKKLIDKFCSPKVKNRVYVIPYDNIAENKVSFGDVRGLRDGNKSGSELAQILNSLPTLREKMLENNISLSDPNFGGNKNFSHIRGVAIYGEISSDGVTYFEVEREYIRRQNKAKELGYPEGARISDYILQDQMPYAEFKELGMEV